ncbi:lactosylceramide 1,3-N-acetyl-beta-D-glucosaminyltransferase isoform X2 [Corvus moneduloides]|uniref:lactosylceramide 1,3-N-acetyl-beta-D-glucosaminyltransferase isoform X2 n=1 Tax=Corvus moneduloides TaxID=1196302 RepID=UPI00136319F2|nr:lactosylceramide 1,3-N-acetyl-beta-D-glucosaminyltransferase isoform X2 [Corvus moneduloides]
MLSKRAFALSKAKKRVSFFVCALGQAAELPRGMLAAGGMRGLARRLPPLFPRRGARSRMAGSCSLPAAPPRPLPGSADAPEDGDGGRRGAGRITIGLRKSGGRGAAGRRQQPSGETPWGRRGVLQPAIFPNWQVFIFMKERNTRRSD